MLIHEFGEGLVRAAFLRRINRFLVEADVEGSPTLCHLHDPGRLSTLLVEGRPLLLIPRKGKRKTRYDVLGVHDVEWVFVHSGYHSSFAETLFGRRVLKELRGYSVEKKEVIFGDSRLDFLLGNGNKCFVEVKGCTLERNGIALFPDAPTVRGRKHVMELLKAQEEGYDAAILFLVMRRATSFSPHWHMDSAFSHALHTFSQKRGKIIACHLMFDGTHVWYKGRIPVIMQPSGR